MFGFELQTLKMRNHIDYNHYHSKVMNDVGGFEKLDLLQLEGCDSDCEESCLQLTGFEKSAVSKEFVLKVQ